MLSSIPHVDLVVSSFNKSLPFYKKLFEVLGWEKESETKGERGERLIYFAGPGGKLDSAIGLRERQSHNRSTPYDRYDLGFHHVAINAPTRRLVNDVAAWLRKEGYKIESGPEEYYNKNYYALFFCDPDGLKLEVVSRE